MGKRVLVLGWDGYLGWPLVQYLAGRGHTVAGLDGYFRRDWVKEVGSHSAVEIATPKERQYAFQEHFGQQQLWQSDLSPGRLKGALEIFHPFQPDAIIHLAECPSASYSMIDDCHAAYVQENNVIGTLNLLFAMRDICPEAHLVKLGTMGEYGTPNVDIPEGFFEIEYRGRKDTLPFPRQAGSFYHLSKVHDTHNIMFACKIWGLRSTDVMQGVVYGTRFNDVEDKRLLTRLDFDECFGTAVNRFCCQAVIGEPLTVYGAGGQTRGYLPLRDSMQCITLAVENPPEPGEYRVFNQFEDTYSVLDLAGHVSAAASQIGLKPIWTVHVDNPRIEAEDHYYNPDHQHLADLGYQPTHDIQAELQLILSDLMQFSDRIESRRSKLEPKIRWKP